MNKDSFDIDSFPFHKFHSFLKRSIMLFCRLGQQSKFILMITKSLLLLGLILMMLQSSLGCDPCYNERFNGASCSGSGNDKPMTLHMSVHPHLDAYWIFNFESYYDPKPHEAQVRGYFMSNRFNSVKEIFASAKETLWSSKQLREKVSNRTQQAHRSFFNSEMGFFKRWYSQQPAQQKQKVRQILKTKYWQILGGGYVEHDEGCAYYDDIIQNFELGLHFLKEEFNYFPRVAVSADSFGHSQSTLAILAHLGVEGFFVERSDEHILLKNKTEFLWRAKSANGRVYGALPAHIRWAIHGFEDQFIGGGSGENMCMTKEGYINNLRNENTFLKRILKSTHGMRYFGHDFQRFDDYSYSVIESMMKKFSLQKCPKVTAVYGNPTQYFITLMGEVFGKKVKPLVTRSQDIFPIWDYDSGLYWTGYLTTDAYHKKSYRDMGRLLRAVRKFYLPLYLSDPKSDRSKSHYQKLEEFAEQVSYLQHHDGISGTSKYKVMDELEVKNNELVSYVNSQIVKDIFDDEFPEDKSQILFQCSLDSQCSIPDSAESIVYLKVLNSDGSLEREPIIVKLPVGIYYTADCPYEINCFCFELNCPCKLYLYPTFTAYISITLTRSLPEGLPIHRMGIFVPNEHYSSNKSHFKISIEGKEYSLGYKRVEAKGTPRQYEHLSRYGSQVHRQFNIRPGKYALGNDPRTARDFSSILKIFTLQSQHSTFFLIHWTRHQMKTLISIPKARPNEWKVQTITATQAYYLSDIYLQVNTPVENKNRFVSDSNGWLTVEREMFKHEDYQAHFSKEGFDDLDGNTYPCTAFVYLEDGKDKISVNVDRPQGVTAPKPGTLWLNFDRLSQDDGKWVYENAYRSEYQKYTHVITAQNKNRNQRKIQRIRDQSLIIQASKPTKQPPGAQRNLAKRGQWQQISNLSPLKFSLRPFNDSTVILRIQNMDDIEEATVGLFAGKHSPLLTSFYGRTVSFESITEQSLGGNMNYQQFVNNKWNWKEVVDLKEENKIFNKVFRENMTLAPLQIRTFLFSGLSIGSECINPTDLKYNSLETSYQLSTTKPIPTRDPLTVKLQQDITKFMLEGDHCQGESPVLAQAPIEVIGTANKGSQQTQFTPTPLKTPVELKPIVLPIPSQESKPLASASQPFSVQPGLSQLSAKIEALKALTRQQKQIYFANKLEIIRQGRQKSKRDH